MVLTYPVVSCSAVLPQAQLMFVQHQMYKARNTLDDIKPCSADSYDIFFPVLLTVRVAAIR